MREHFGELRGLVEQVPSTSAFENILYFINAHASPEHRTQVEGTWMPYLADKLSAWPDATRLCPKPLLEEYESADAVWCPLVRALDFEGEKLAKMRTARILDAHHMTDVTHVDLRSTYIKWDQLNDIAAASPFGAVKHLCFRKGTKGPDLQALGNFFASPMLAATSSLSFAGWRNISAGVYDVLLEHFPVEHLRRLDVSGPKILSAKRLAALLDTGRFSDLEEFRFYRGPSEGSKGLLKSLCSATELTQMKSIRGAGASDACIRALAESEHFSRLESLRLTEVTCEPATLEALCSSPNFPALRDLTLGIEGRGEAFAQGQARALLRAVGAGALLRQVERLALSSSSTHPSLSDFLDAADHDLDHLTHFAWHPWSHQKEEEARARSVGDDLLALRQTSFSGLQALMLRFYSSREAQQNHHLLRSLHGAPWLPSLQELQVYGEAFHPDELLEFLLSSESPQPRVLGFGAPLCLEQWGQLFEQSDLSRLEILRAWDHKLYEHFDAFCALLAEHAHHLPHLRRLIVNESLRYHVPINPLRGPQHVRANQWVSLETEYTFDDANPVWLLTCD